MLMHNHKSDIKGIDAILINFVHMNC